MQNGLKLSSFALPGSVWSVITVAEWTGASEESKERRRSTSQHEAVRLIAVHVVQGRIHP
jgi:hypothetical protein